MRTREEVIKHRDKCYSHDGYMGYMTTTLNVVLEVLLDIRDLLAASNTKDPI